jgi:hypothetical protein
MGKSLDVITAANARIAEMGKRYAAGKGRGYNFGARHCAAFNMPLRPAVTPLGALVVRTVTSAAKYADWHLAEYGTPIGHDYVLGEGFARILQGVRTLLNGDTGNLDCGTLDSMILDIASVNGIDPDWWELGKDVGTYADTHKPEASR